MQSKQIPHRAASSPEVTILQHPSSLTTTRKLTCSSTGRSTSPKTGRLYGCHIALGLSRAKNHCRSLHFWRDGHLERVRRHGYAISYLRMTNIYHQKLLDTQYIRHQQVACYLADFFKPCFSSLIPRFLSCRCRPSLDVCWVHDISISI
jgi:hypothetical protein